jgi:cytochrome c-type biogenesis protein CcmF
VLIAAVGIAVASVYKHESEWTLSAHGPTQQYGPYGLRLDTVYAVKEPNRDGVIAGVMTFKNGKELQYLKPRLNYYRTMNEPVATPSVHAAPQEDLYLVLVAYDQQGKSATIKAIVSPMVGWIWIGGIVIGLGVIFALWPRRKMFEPEPSGRTEPLAEPMVGSAPAS